MTFEEWKGIVANMATTWPQVAEWEDRQIIESWENLKTYRAKDIAYVVESFVTIGETFPPGWGKIREKAKLHGYSPAMVEAPNHVGCDHVWADLGDMWICPRCKQQRKPPAGYVPYEANSMNLAAIEIAAREENHDDKGRAAKASH